MTLGATMRVLGFGVGALSLCFCGSTAGPDAATGGAGAGGDIEAGGSAAGAGGQGEGGQISGDPTLLGELVPFQDWPPVELGTEGLLYVPEAWGAAIDWGLGVREIGLQTYWFSFDRSSPFAVYFASNGEGENFIPDWSVPVSNGEGTATFDAAMFTPETENIWGLSRKAHVVRVEPNAGKGGVGLHFVATDVEVLDSEPGYLKDPVAVLDKLRNDFDAAVAALSAEMDTQMKEASDAANPGKGATPVGDDLVKVVALWPTWLQAERHLQATFIFRWQRAWEHTEHVVPEAPYCPDGASCPQPEPPYDARILHVFGIETATVYEVDSSGSIVSEESVPISTMPVERREERLPEGE